MDIKIDTKQMVNIEKAFKDFPKLAKKSLPPAINRTLSTVSTKVQKEITLKYKIKKSELSGGSKYKSETSNNLIKVKKASSNDQSGTLYIRGSTLTLSRFLQGNKSPISHKGKTMSQIKKIKSPKTQITRGNVKSIKGAFVQQAKGTVGIFVRDHNGKLRMLRTLSVAQMASNKAILETANQTANEVLEKRMQHELQRRLDKIEGDINSSS